MTTILTLIAAFFVYKALSKPEPLKNNVVKSCGVFILSRAVGSSGVADGALCAHSVMTDER